MSYSDNYEQAFRIMQNMRRAQRRGEVFGVSGIVNVWAQAQRRRDKTMNHERSALVERIRSIDPKAAEWLDKEYPDGGHFPNGGSLSCWFCWHKTPQGHQYWSNIACELRREETMKDKMTEEQAKLYAALLWEELRKLEYYLNCQPNEVTKKAAAEKLVNAGILPESALTWGFACPYCELYHRDPAPCPGCPYDKVHGRCTSHGPYNRWQMDPSPETARAMADFCWSVYRGQDGSDKERKACACCKGEEAKAGRFAEGDRVKLLDTASGSTTNMMATCPKWNNTRVGGTVIECERVQWDNGSQIALWDSLISPLTTTERLMLTQRPIRPGDVFKYCNGEGLRTLVVVSDGDDDDDVWFHFLDVTDVDSPFIVTEGFDPDEEREVDDRACCHREHLGYTVEFERLVPVGRMRWSVEPKA